MENGKILDSSSVVSVIGAGTMGRGIAQVAAANGHVTRLIDTQESALESAETYLNKIMVRLVEKGRLSEDAATQLLRRISYEKQIERVEGSDLVIEAIIENLDIKQTVFQAMESAVENGAVLASNTSSLSIASIGSSLNTPERFLGIHFFNPAPLMPLVEIVPGIATSDQTISAARSLIDTWGKTTVLVKDTPGFIVNRVARPFYSEAIRMLEESVADAPTIDWAMREIGGFRMGPFELMDFIGNDINYKVTESVFEAFFYDPRFKPSFTQKRLFEAGYFGRKSGRGYYNYGENATNPSPVEDKELGEQILNRILVMLINEAADAVFLNVASVEDIDLAMTKGMNYPKGLLAWADEIGLEQVLASLEELQDEYGEDRYRPNPLIKRMVLTGDSFYV